MACNNSTWASVAFSFVVEKDSNKSYRTMEGREGESRVQDYIWGDLTSL